MGELPFIRAWKPRSLQTGGLANEGSLSIGSMLACPVLAHSMSIGSSGLF